MYICFIDEAGDTGPLKTTNKLSTPVFVLTGLIIHYESLVEFTKEFLTFKRCFYPGMFNGMAQMDVILTEVKGSELRKPEALKSERRFIHIEKQLSAYLNLLEKHKVKAVGRIQVKNKDVETSSDAIYTAGLQHICKSFNQYLDEKEAIGVIICDSRNHKQDIQSSHAIFTQKFKHDGDSFPRIVEMSTFGRSDNHSGIQAADLISSALLFPIAVNTYCQEFSKDLRNSHVQPSYRKLRDKFWRRLNDFQYRYQDESGRRTGGIWVSDNLGGKLGKVMFQKPEPDDSPASRSSLNQLVNKFNSDS